METAKNITVSFETVKKIVSSHGISHARESAKKINQFSVVHKILLFELDKQPMLYESAKKLPPCYIRKETAIRLFKNNYDL